MSIGCVSLVKSVRYTAAYTLLKLSASDRCGEESFMGGHTRVLMLHYSLYFAPQLKINNRFANEDEKTIILCFE